MNIDSVPNSLSLRIYTNDSSHLLSVCYMPEMILEILTIYALQQIWMTAIRSMLLQIREPTLNKIKNLAKDQMKNQEA